MLSEAQLRPASVIDARLSQGTHRKSGGIIETVYSMSFFLSSQDNSSHLNCIRWSFNKILLLSVFLSKYLTHFKLKLKHISSQCAHHNRFILIFNWIFQKCKMNDCYQLNDNPTDEPALTGIALSWHKLDID